MTVRYLWKILEDGCCGTAVGIQDMISMSRKVFAVDISIWICEALTSTALNTFHSNPAVYLVFQRTVALLKMGIKIVAVLDGQERKSLRNNATRSDNWESKVEQKSVEIKGSHKFWESCTASEEILSLLGVPVLYAESNGEGLCALLNERGLVDGVISNDGDCFLYGAKHVYTNFSIDNLLQGTVTKYNESTLCTTISDNTISLSRQDLIAFAILTGSDELGSGVPYVGAQKATRLIYLLKKMNPHQALDAALNEIQAWTDVSNEEEAVEVSDTNVNVSLPDSYNISHTDKKFIQSIKEKVLSYNKYFSPAAAIQEYLCPNHDVIPDYATLMQRSPNFDQLIGTTVLIKGKTIQTSRDYVESALLKLSARLMIMRRSDSDCQRNRYYKTFPSNKVLVEAKQIVNKCHYKGHSCYEVLWNYGCLEFSTREWEISVKKAFPSLVEIFNDKERLGKQLDLKNYRLKMFLGNHHDRTYQLPFERKRQIEQALILRPFKNSKRRRGFKEIKRSRQEIKANKNISHTSDDAVYLVSNSMAKTDNSKSIEAIPMNSDMYFTPTFSRKVPIFDSMENNLEIYATYSFTKENHSYDDLHEKDFEIRNDRSSISDNLYEVETWNEHCKYNYENNSLLGIPHLDDDAKIYCEMGGFQIHVTPVESTHRIS